jgi:response regulator RpfG family c-di-GMP phosphodiesterase/signal transduction histidine kinase
MRSPKLYPPYKENNTAMTSGTLPRPSRQETFATFSLIKDLSNIFHVTENLAAIANMILDIVVSYTGAAKCSMMLINERRELSIIASRGIDIDIIRDYRSKLGEGVAGIVATLFQPVLVEDIETDERFNGFKRGIYRTKSFISCPVIAKKRLFGLLNASDRKDLSAFTGQEFNLMQVIAHQAAIAMENAFMVSRLRAKTVDLEEINRKLIDSDVVKTEFLTRLSHELRSPLNSIKGSVYYLDSSETLTWSERKEFHSIISKEAVKLSTFVESQLDFLRFEDEMRSIDKSVICIADILTEISGYKSLCTNMGKDNLSLDLQVSEGTTEVVGDRIKVSQMFFNLIEGLASYMEKEGSLRICVTENENIKVTIKAEVELPDMVSEAFSRPDMSLHGKGSKDRIKFYLAKKTAEFHGWTLTTKQGKGTFTVSVHIPKSRKQKVDAAVGKSIDLFLEFISELLGLDICSIMLNDEITGELRIQSAMGLTDEIVRRTRIRLGDRISGWVAMEGKPLLIEDIESDDRFNRRSISQYNTKSLLSVPLKIGDKVVGVLNLNNKKTAEPFTAQDLSIATVLGTRVSRLIEKLTDDENCEEGFKELTTSFDKLLSASRKYHKKSRLFRDLVRKVMERLESSNEERNMALYVSALYDLGLMIMDEAIINRKQLEPSEVDSLKIHPFTTVELLNGFEYSHDVKKAILHHHERFDGKGYPNGLAGEEIPLISRVIAVVDGYCALVSKKPHGKENTTLAALEVIGKDSGTCYDPVVVNALTEVLMV